MISVNTIPNQHAEHKELVYPALKNPDSPVFSLQHINIDVAADIKKIYAKALAATLNDWRDIITRRVKLGEREIGIQEQFDSDKSLLGAYCDLLDTTATHVEQFLTEKKQKYTHIMILADADARIQAVAALTVKENAERVVVETLISAPWNVPMNSKIATEHKALCVRGAGTTMMRQIYEFALLKNKKKIELRPLDSARSFYVDTLKMIPSEQSPVVHYVVSPDNLPEKLEVSSGNLLKNLQTDIN